VNSSNMIKIIAAFVGGIVIALGSALIYVKANDRGSQQALVQTPPPAETSPADARSLPDADTTPAAPSPQPDKQEPPASKTVSKRPVNSSLGHRYRHNDEPSASQKPVEVAQNTTPPDPPANPYGSGTATAPPAPAPAAPAPAPAPAVTPAVPAPAPAPVRQPRTVTLPMGTSINIRLGETLSTNHNYSGDTFRATLDTPIVMQGAVIAERGSKVLGKIVTAEKAGKVKGVSDLTLTLTEINTTDGQRVPIQTGSYDQKGPTSTGKDAAKVGGGAALGAIIGAIAGGGKGAGIGAGVGGAAGAGDVLLTRGKPSVIENESRLNFQLSAPATITERLNY
jgi:hypothetical protein